MDNNPTAAVKHYKSDYCRQPVLEDLVEVVRLLLVEVVRLLLVEVVRLLLVELVHLVLDEKTQKQVEYK